MGAAVNKANGRQNRKHEGWFKSYAARMQREKNKIKKVKRHLKKFPGDAQAEDNLKLIMAGKPGKLPEQKYVWVINRTTHHKYRILKANIKKAYEKGYHKLKKEENDE